MADAGVAGLAVALQGALQVQLGGEVGFFEAGEVGRVVGFEVGLAGAEAGARGVFGGGVGSTQEARLGRAEGDEADLFLELGAAERV